MSPDEAGSFQKEFEGATEGIDAMGISLHNLSVGIPMFVPAFGIGWGCYTGWSTGAGFAALIQTNPNLAQTSSLSVLLLSTYGAMEVVAYSIGMSRSMIIFLTIIRKKSLKQQLLSTLIEIGIMIVLLLVAGFIEYSMMNQG